MTKCVECGKNLGFFEGYSHPTLGKKNLVCRPCFVKVEESVARWRDFVLLNSFNPESSTPTLNIDWSSLFTRISGIRKQLSKDEEQKSSHADRRGKNREMALTQVNRIGNETLIQLGGRTV